MKYFLIALAVLAVFPSFAKAQTCEQSAKELELKINKINQDLDKATFGKLVAEDALFVLADGSTTSKKQQAELFPELPPNFAISFTSTEVKIRVCVATTIVMTGKDVISTVNKTSQETSAQSFRFTRIYEKRQGAWQLVFSQLTGTKQ